MICHTCLNEAVENHANNKKFYYCRTCKVEVNDYEPVPTNLLGSDCFSDLTPEERKEMDDWLAGIKTNALDSSFDDDYDDLF